MIHANKTVYVYKVLEYAYVRIMVFLYNIAMILKLITSLHRVTASTRDRGF